MTQELLDEVAEELEDLRAKETFAWKRRTFIARKQQAVANIYESEMVQYMVAALIVSNFLVEAFRSRSRHSRSLNLASPSSAHPPSLQRASPMTLLLLACSLILNIEEKN